MHSIKAVKCSMIYFTQPVARILFALFLLLTLVLALMPIQIGGGLAADKVQHFLAFLALALLGVIGWGRTRMVLIATALALLGGMIEMLQSTSFVGRDAELYDWVADLAGIVASILLTACFGPKGPSDKVPDTP